MTVRILEGDCRDVLRTLPDDSVHSIVTDPPYELGFMGKSWDSTGIAYDIGMWRECLRVLKPGGHLLAFGGSRTYHRLACAIEDAGFEVRDQIMWLYGSGFPKSKNLDGEWEGWGTALKPAHEPIVVARKPLIGTVAANVQTHGCGALNIDGCRIPTSESKSRDHEAADARIEVGATGMVARAGAFRGGDPAGRWPANVIHDGSKEVLARFPDAPGQQGDLRDQDHAVPAGSAFGQYGPKRSHAARNDVGSAARFFYCAKASKADREAGCEGLPTKRGGMVSNTSGQHITRRDGGEPGERANHHPTVKPTELMRYLVRLVTPTDGIVLDPFAGSGSTGRAAAIEGFAAILIEKDPGYAEIARRRISGDAPLLAEVASA